MSAWAPACLARLTRLCAWRPGVARVLCCGQTLHFLEGAGTRVLPYEGEPAALPAECGAGWRHHTTLRDVESAVAARAPQAAVVRVRVVLQQSSTHMRIPLPREEVFGRDDQIAQLVDALVPEGARVLVHGCAGVGKDTLVAAVLRSNAFRDRVPAASVAAWLHGSTAEMLERQLVAYFRAHRRHVLRDAQRPGQDLTGDAALGAIRGWLEHHDGWLFVVEDVTWACSSLSRAIPLACARGRVVVTSKEVLVDPRPGGAQPMLPPAPRTHVLHLGTIETRHSVDLWRSMRVFRRARDLEARAWVLREDELRQACDAAAVAAAADDASAAQTMYAAPPPGEEAEPDRDKRHEGMTWALRELALQAACAGTDGAVEYKPAGAAGGDAGTGGGAGRGHAAMAEDLRDYCRSRSGVGAGAPEWTGATERRTDAFSRLKKKAATDWADQQLGRADLHAFLKEELGNLPLSVKLVGRMLTAGEGACLCVGARPIAREWVVMGRSAERGWLF